MRSHQQGEGLRPLPLARTVRRRLIAWLVACVPLLILLQIAHADADEPRRETSPNDSQDAPT